MKRTRLRQYKIYNISMYFNMKDIVEHKDLFFNDRYWFTDFYL